MKLKTLALCSAATLALSGCGLFDDDGMFRNRSKDYLVAEEMPPIVVPEELDREAVGQLYPIPAVAETAILDESGEVPRPMPLSESNLEEVVKIQSLGDERWILSNRSPSEVWPRIRNILNRSGIPTARAEASEGVLETGWLEFKDDDSHNHRYRFYIQPGVQVNSTEVKLLHDQASKDSETETQDDWPEASVDGERESQMIEIMANAMAGEAGAGSVSMLAQGIGGEQKVDFVTPKVADPYLLMHLDYERAWASVSYSLGRGGFSTIDQNQSEGVFYVNYTPEDQEEPGFFGRLLTFGGDDDKVAVNYQVLLTRAEDGIQVRVVDSERSGIPRNEAIRLLTIVRANLS